MLSLRTLRCNTVPKRYSASPSFRQPRLCPSSFFRAKSDAWGSVPSLKGEHAENATQTFGFLARDEHLAQRDGPQSEFTRSVELREENVAYETSMSPFRNSDGSFIQGDNAEEARLHPDTLKARVDTSPVHLPEEIAKVINKNILSHISPDKLRERAASIYQSLEKDQIQKAPESSLDADAHIAALFLQNYAHSVRVLKELLKRVPHFSPNSVLDIGYGPATGMIALNELMGSEFRPAVKEAYIVGRGNKEMKKRAKILLSRQLNEVLEQAKEVRQDTKAEKKIKESGEGVSAYMPDPSLKEAIFDSQTDTNIQNDSPHADTLSPEQDYQGYYDRFGDFVGPVDSSRVRIQTRLRDALPSSKQYELIMVNQSLLSREFNFPRDVDLNIEMILRLLKPDGHLVILERGNALGFEIVARARQVMLRPENHRDEPGRIPRPYIRGSSVKPQKLRREDQIITEDHVTHEKELLARLEAEDRDSLEQELEEKFGPVSEEDLKFEFENDPDFELSEKPVHPATPVPSTSVDYHLSVVAPCSHHGQCPLQLGDPKFYQISNHKHRLQFCSFNQVVHRPKYTMELKKGKRLATKWDKSSHDGFGTDQIPRSTLKGMQGTGRTGGNNTESGNLSYLIMHRAKNDPQAIAAIDEARAHNFDTSTALPRILDFPNKVKKNVRLKVCAPSGHIEYWQIPKSLGKQTYHDARKAKQGDLWALDKKSAVVKSRLSAGKVEKLNKLAKMQRKFVVKEKRKRDWKKLVSRSESDFDDPLDVLDDLASDVESSKRYRTQGKRAQYDVNPRDFDGN